MRLSKSRFTAGLQCARLLWWRVHEPDAPELAPDETRQAVFDQGHRVGAAARARFPGGVLIDLPHDAFEQRVTATRAAMDGGAPAIFEASFVADDTFVAVDALERRPGGWRLVEVKSSTRVKTQHLQDVAVQVHVVRGSGVPVESAEVMHVNRACTYPDLSDLFARVPVLPEVERILPGVPGRLRAQLAMLGGDLPTVAIGLHCEEPYPCPFQGRCWPEWPADHVRRLYFVGKRSWELAANGYTSIDRLPDGMTLHPAAERQRRALRLGRRIVEPTLAVALERLVGPLAVIDFETVSPAIPVWDGCHPYDPVPAQFSCHKQEADGAWTHHHWLANDTADPRPELIRRLADACRGARTILAYYAPFEAGVLAQAALAFPKLHDPVQSILDRIVDAHPLVRDHVYDPGFNGSFSLKAVLPVLVPGLGYDDLPIAEGQAASRHIERMLFGDPPPHGAERRALRDALRRYCERDTLGVVRLVETLRTLAAGAAGPV